MNKYITALFLTPALTLSQMPLTQAQQLDGQKLTRLAQPAVVRVFTACSGAYRSRDGNNIYHEFSEGSMGSGFLISSDGYIVTSAHFAQEAKGKEQCKKELFYKLASKVIPPETRPSLSIQKYLEENPRSKSYIERLYNFIDNEFEYWQHVILPNNSLQSARRFEIKESGTPLGSDKGISGKDVAIIKIQVKNAPTLQIANSDEIQTQDTILIVGYPSQADSWKEFDENSIFLASVTDGKVSANNKKTTDGASVLQISAPISEGSSGSPVLDKNGKVVGVVSFGNKINGVASPGFGFAVPSDVIKEYIREAGATNEPGRIDQLYRKGLKLYENKQYPEAKETFEQVQGLFPDHATIKELINDSNQKGADNIIIRNPYLYILAIAALVAAIPLLAFLLLRRRSSGQYAAQRSQQSSRDTGYAYRDTSVGGSIPKSSTPGNGSRLKSTIEFEYQGQRQEFYLNKSEHRLGRDPDWADLRIPIQWEGISRKQAILRKEGEDYRIYDGDGNVPSRNGLRINGFSLIGPEGHPLRSGDQIKIGQDPREQITLTYFNPNIDTLTVKAAPVTGDSYFYHSTYQLSSHLTDRG